jgi:hypothetical protein
MILVFINKTSNRRVFTYCTHVNQIPAYRFYIVLGFTFRSPIPIHFDQGLAARKDHAVVMVDLNVHGGTSGQEQ